MESDGIISANNIVLEPEAHHALQEWCVETKKSFYVVGPLLSEESQLETVKHRSKEHNDVQRFLDKIYQNFGARSLLYVSYTLEIPVNAFIKIFIPSLFSSHSEVYSGPPEMVFGTSLE